MINLSNIKLLSVSVIVLSIFIISGCSTVGKDGIYESYYRTGSVKTIDSYKNGKLDGIAREYYEIGTLKHAVEYKSGKISGMSNTYYPDGAVWKKEIYQDGRFLSQWEYDEEGMVVSDSQ